MYFPNVQKDWRIRRKKFLLSTMPGDFKGIAFRKNLMGVIFLPKMNSFKIKFFWISLKLKLLNEYIENMLNGEINTESVYISVNYNTNFKKILILSICTIWDILSLKTISRYCPFKLGRGVNATLFYAWRTICSRCWRHSSWFDCSSDNSSCIAALVFCC